MNSNRKKNLRKLVRDLISAVTVMSSISGASTKANEIEPPHKEERSGMPAWVTPAILGVGFAGLGYLNYKNNQARLATDKEFNSQEFALRQKEAEANLHKKENKAILEKNGMETTRAVKMCATINKIKARNNSKRWTTTDDLITALKNDGPMTKDVLSTLYRVVNIDSETDVENALLEALAKKFTNDDRHVGRLKDAVDTLINTLKDGGEIKQSTLFITGRGAAVNNTQNWDRSNNGLDRTKQIGAAADANAIDMDFITSKEYTPKNGNYTAADKLLPPDLANVVGDMVWCGIATPFGSDGENQVTVPANDDNNNTARTAWTLLGDNDNVKKNMKNAHMPLYLSLTCRRNDVDKNSGRLDGRTVWSIPLFNNKWDKRGKEEDKEIMPDVAKWIMSVDTEVGKSDRVSNGDAEWK